MYPKSTTFESDFNHNLRQKEKLMHILENQISLKELLEIAVSELSVLTTVSNPDFRLEQAEFIDTKNEWEIVVSFLVENTNKRNNPLLGISMLDFERIYKKLTIDTERHIKGYYFFKN